MKTMLIVILISGILLGIQALECEVCGAYETSNAGYRKRMEDMMGRLSTCNGAKICSAGMDRCATSIVDYRLNYLGEEISARFTARTCFSSESDVSRLCNFFPSAGRFYKEVTCTTETCSTDGCNAAMSTMSDY